MSLGSGNRDEDLLNNPIAHVESHPPPAPSPTFT
jgi:hypothetical protein